MDPKINSGRDVVMMTKVKNLHREISIKTAFAMATLLRFIMVTTCDAAPLLDATTTPSYMKNHQIFKKAGGSQSKVRGFVRLASGFTIAPDASVLFDSFITVSGQIDMKETGTIILASDMFLDQGMTLSSGGMIDGQGYALVLGSNLTLPSNKIIHLKSNTIIDGRGHTLTIGDYAQLFVDSSVMLTLQNMVLKSGAKTSVFPPVRCASSGSQLVLDNVVFEPGADIPFYQGGMSIYDTVLFTGTSALIYNSPQASMIKSGAALMFDKMTTFSYAPASTSKDLILMQDATSRIILDGCTLKCTDTGFRLTTGQLLCDNKVILDSSSGVSLASVTTITSGIYRKSSGGGLNAMRACWSPDGKVFAVTGDNGLATRVYKIYGDGGLLGVTIGWAPLSTNMVSVAWSPDRRYIAIGGWQVTFFLGIYPFNGSAVGSNIYTISTPESPFALDWSPDNKYLAFGSYGGNGIFVYSFNGVTAKQVATTSYTNTPRGGLHWHPNGNYFAIAGESGLFVYGFNGSSLTQTATKSWSVTIYDIAWSPDGQYLAVGGATPNLVDGNILAADNIRIYSFNSVTGVLTPVIGRKYGTTVYSLGWHPDGKTLAVGGAGAASGGTNNPFNDTNLLRFYKFTGSSLERLFSYALSSPLSNITTIWSSYWDPSGKYLVLAGVSSDVTEYYGVLQASFVPSPSPQAFSNSIIFGCSTGNFAQSALYGNPASTDKTSFVNSLLTKQGGTFTITARDEVITGTMSSFTYTGTNFSVGQKTYFWNRGWPLFTTSGVGPADTLWTKFHAVGTQDIVMALANVASIDATSKMITTTMSYVVDIGGPTGTASFIGKGNPENGYAVKKYHGNPTQILDGDNALIAPSGGDYWASFNRNTKEISWGKGTTFGFDQKQTYTDASRFSGINRVGFCSSTDAIFSNVSIGAGMDASTYTYTASNTQHDYFVNGGWVLPGGTNDVKWIKYYAAGTNDADICFSPRANINTISLLSSNSYLYYLRGWSNTQSALAKGNRRSYSTLTGYSTAGGLPGYFWASVQQNGTSSVTLQWGTGTVIGQNVAQSYTDSSSPVLNIDRVMVFSGGVHPFSQIQVGYGADPGTSLSLRFADNSVQTLYQNQSLVLSAAQIIALNPVVLSGLNVKMLSGARAEIRGKVMDDSV